MSTQTTHSKKDKNLKSLNSYVLGFLLSLILTLIAFFVVAKHSLPQVDLMATLMVLAVVQLFVQVVFFLRLNATPEGRWNLMPFLCAILIVLVLVFGSIWIMANLNYNMVN